MEEWLARWRLTSHALYYKIPYFELHCGYALRTQYQQYGRLMCPIPDALYARAKKNETQGIFLSQTSLLVSIFRCNPQALRKLFYRFYIFPMEGDRQKILSESGVYFSSGQRKLISSREIKMFLQKSVLRKFSPSSKVYIEIFVMYSYKLLLRSLKNEKYC